VSGQVMAADGADQAAKSVRSFWRAGQLYELCISKADNERAHCEGFITGLASTLQDAQLSRVPICLPKGTSSQDVVSKVVWYLREKADADDLKLPARAGVGHPLQLHARPAAQVHPALIIAHGRTSLGPRFSSLSGLCDSAVPAAPVWGRPFFRASPHCFEEWRMDVERKHAGNPSSQASN
jgi:hypothetical protein